MREVAAGHMFQDFKIRDVEGDFETSLFEIVGEVRPCSDSTLTSSKRDRNGA